MKKNESTKYSQFLISNSILEIILKLPNQGIRITENNRDSAILGIHFATTESSY